METGVLCKRVIARMEMRAGVDDEEIHNVIDEVIADSGRESYIPIDTRVRLHRDIFSAIRGFGVLQDYIDDPDVTEIMVNGARHIYVERDGNIFECSSRFEDEQQLKDIIQRIVGMVNRRVNESSPIVDARLRDGSRVNAVLSPVAVDGAAVTIRKFPKEKMTMKELISLKSISQCAGDFLGALVTAGYNIFVSGGTGSGKTTFLNVLSDFIPSDERVITIEDSAELQMRGIKNLVRLEARQANTEGENIITIRDLIRTSLRMRPDRIIVGEVRGNECIDMLQAMNTGHDGSMSTGHANSTRDILSRLETMVLMAVDIPLSAVKGQISSAIDIIVHLGRRKDKSRKVMEITEVLGLERGEIVLNPLFAFGDNGAGTAGELRQVGELKHTEKLKRAGVNIEKMEELF